MSKEMGLTTGMIPLLMTPGELFDRITILQLRYERTTAPATRELIAASLARTQAAWASARIDDERTELRGLTDALATVNEALWEEEDRIRDCERREDFGAAFVTSARTIARLNDRRAALKRQISERCGLHTADELKLYGS